MDMPDLCLECDVVIKNASANIVLPCPPDEARAYGDSCVDSIIIFRFPTAFEKCQPHESNRETYIYVREEKRVLVTGERCESKAGTENARTRKSCNFCNLKPTCMTIADTPGHDFGVTFV